MIVCETTAAVVPHLRREDEWPVSASGNTHDERQTLCGQRVGWDLLYESAHARCRTCLAIAEGEK